jgi:hypothetical protein
VEAAAVAAANEGVSAGGESREGDECLHHGKRGQSLVNNERKAAVGRKDRGIGGYG